MGDGANCQDSRSCSRPKLKRGADTVRCRVEGEEGEGRGEVPVSECTARV